MARENCETTGSGMRIFLYGLKQFFDPKIKNRKLTLKLLRSHGRKELTLVNGNLSSDFLIHMHNL